jgi:hypothetical protein
MAGQIKRMIDRIVEQRAKGNAALKNTTITKLILKGINPDSYTLMSPDDPAVIRRLQEIAGEMGLTL